MKEVLLGPGAMHPFPPQDGPRDLAQQVERLLDGSRGVANADKGLRFRKDRARGHHRARAAQLDAPFTNVPRAQHVQRLPQDADHLPVDVGGCMACRLQRRTLQHEIVGLGDVPRQPLVQDRRHIEIQEP